MPQRAPDVERVVRAWLDDKQAARAEDIGTRLADYEGALAIGTAQGEWFSGSEEFASAHVAGGPFTATIESIEAHEDGSVAWAAARAAVDTGDDPDLNIRLTLVLVRVDDDTWRIVQSHASVPDES